jgi:selenium-binding protein 1
MVTSTWGTPNMVKDGVNPELLLGGKYGSKLHVWDPRPAPPYSGRSTSARSSRWCSSCGLRTTRPSAYGFVGVVRVPQGSVFVDLDVVTASRGRTDRRRRGPVKKVIEIPAEAADPGRIRRCSGFQGRRAARDRHQSLARRPLPLCAPAGARESSSSTTVSDPFKPKKVGSIKIGGIVSAPRTRTNRCTAQTAAADGRDQPRRRRVYFTNGPLHAVGRSVLSDGVRGWMAKVNVNPDGGMELTKVLLESDGMRRIRCVSKAATRRRFVLLLVRSGGAETRRVWRPASPMQWTGWR